MRFHSFPFKGAQKLPETCPKSISQLAQFDWLLAGKNGQFPPDLNPKPAVKWRKIEKTWRLM
jgi:hypothetical protein